MKIKLISPHEEDQESASSSSTFKIPRLNLPLLAALTPNEHQVIIVDEAFAPDNYDDDIDLVGITVMTELALRSYRIAEEYKKRGIKVVMGGIHPTILPQEALRFADAVVIGEAENLWYKIVNDAFMGKLEKIYVSSKISDLANLPRPKWKLYPKPRNQGYTPVTYTVESARGCPYDCEFCSVPLIYERSYRIRPIADVIADIESIESKNLFFVDDAIGLNRYKFKKLLLNMIPLNRRWVGQGTISLGEDEQIIKLMQKSGCMGLLLGFESLQETIKNRMPKIKHQDVDFPTIIKRFHDNGIAIMGAFVFGFDNEDKDIFNRTLDFCNKNRLDLIQPRILVPFPGTKLYNRFKSEGRLYDAEWWLKGLSSDMLLFEPRNMSPREFIGGFNMLVRASYSNYSIIKRFFGINPLIRKPFGIKLYTGINLGQKKRYFHNLKVKQVFI